MVDGTTTKGSESYRAISKQLRQGSGRELPTCAHEEQSVACDTCEAISEPGESEKCVQTALRRL